MFKYSDPRSPGGHFLSQSGAPRLRSSRTTISMPPSNSPSPPLFDVHHDRYPPLLRDSLDDDLFHGPRRATLWSKARAVPANVYRASQARFGRRRGPAFLCLCGLVLVLATVAVHRRYMKGKTRWNMPFPRPDGPVFATDEVRKIWEWEILAGHYPSTRPIPPEVALPVPLKNPALPASVRNASWVGAQSGPVQHTLGSGVERVYPELRSRPLDFGHPPRPIPGSTADFDKIMQNCDGDQGHYIRDCLEFLRLGAGLDDSARLRRDNIEDLRYVFVPGDADADTVPDYVRSNAVHRVRTSDKWTRELPTPASRRQDAHCSEDDPRIFHLFWAGPFTDKPYMALMAFLFTQNLGLHLDESEYEPSACRPQLWLWLSRGPADTMPSATAKQEMYEELRHNAWALPFLHPRFKDVIQFKLWNTTEQLDHAPELRNEWRLLGDQFLTSEGKVPKSKPGNKIGSEISLDGKSKEDHTTYSKVPVVLSDLVRFVLCHRYGGAYLDVDMLLLRDWEELWGWRGSFSYRWSHENLYNTAVLRLRRQSALGTFILRTALMHGLDFHPTTVSHYLQDAHMEQLLYRLPDALFDPAWKSADYVKKWWGWKMEYFERDRPPFPFFPDFDYFFNTPADLSAAPSSAGFDSFFRGAYAYHYHNEWWKPFDQARFWPDLGPRFADAEHLGRTAIPTAGPKFPKGIVPDDKRDLDWATVLKRTFEAYIRGERPNMYGEWIRW